MNVCHITYAEKKRVVGAKKMEKSNRRIGKSI